MRSTTAARRIVFCSIGFLAACSAAPPPSTVEHSTKMATPAVASNAKTPPPESTTLPKPAGKLSPEMAGKLSPIPAMVASGDDWTFEMRGTQGMEHRADLLFGKGAKRFEGVVTYRDSNEHIGVRWMRFDGTLRSAQGDVPFSMNVGKQACKGRDGRQMSHTLRFILGREEYVGCADVAMY